MVADSNVSSRLVFEVVERLWLLHSLRLAEKAVTRKRAASVPGSEVHGMFCRELEQLGRLREKVERLSTDYVLPE